MHTTPEMHTNSNISGWSHLSRPPSPHKELEVIWRKKVPTPNPLPLCHSHKQCNVPQHQCPYARPPHVEPSNNQFSPISGPPPQAKLCLDKQLAHLAFLNSTLQHTPEDHNPMPSEPWSPTTSSSTPSSPQSPSSASSEDSKSEPESTGGQSPVSMASNRQLCPCIPISYETFLKNCTEDHKSK